MNAEALTRMHNPIAISPRERETLRLIAEGHSNNTIAIKMEISPNTAKFHIANLLKKLGADNRAQLAATAVRMGLA
jgi:DNA-binding CsgD family transcriptional regulator